MRGSFLPFLLSPSKAPYPFKKGVKLRKPILYPKAINKSKEVSHEGG